MLRYSATLSLSLSLSITYTNNMNHGIIHKERKSGKGKIKEKTERRNWKEKLEIPGCFVALNHSLSLSLSHTRNHRTKMMHSETEIEMIKR